MDEVSGNLASPHTPVRSRCNSQLADWSATVSLSSRRVAARRAAVTAPAATVPLIASTVLDWHSCLLR